MLLVADIVTKKGDRIGDRGEVIPQHLGGAASTRSRASVSRASVSGRSSKLPERGWIRYNVAKSRQELHQAPKRRFQFAQRPRCSPSRHLEINEVPVNRWRSEHTVWISARDVGRDPRAEFFRSSSAPSTHLRSPSKNLQLNIAPSADEFRRSIRRIRELGWLAKVHNAGEAWLEIEHLLLEAKLPVIIDRLGHVDLRKGINQPVFRMFWRLIDRGNFWMMVSNSDRYSIQERGWDDAIAFVSSVIERAPDRTIWCSDWPHVQYRKPMPTDTELIELLCQATPNLELRRKVLSETPATLFGFYKC